MTQAPLDVEEIRTLVSKHSPWYHRIEVYPGVITPGVNDTAVSLERLDKLGLPQDCTGLRALDIGCADGYFSFLLEKRGATDVVAIDYRKTTTSGFDIAHGILGSKVRFFHDNVYNLTRDKYGAFDIVIFSGILYHLRNPLMALDVVRGMTRTGGKLFAETHIIDDAVQLADGSTVKLTALSPLLEGAPLWQFYRGDSLNRDITNKWAPNMTGFRHIVEEAQFKIINSKAYGLRGCLHAEAIEEPTSEKSRRMDAGTQ